MFRFTIRDVLWLTVVVALGVGWWLDRSRLESERDDARIFKQTEFEKMEREIRADLESAMRDFFKPS